MLEFSEPRGILTTVHTPWTLAKMSMSKLSSRGACCRTWLTLKASRNRSGSEKFVPRWPDSSGCSFRVMKVGANTIGSTISCHFSNRSFWGTESARSHGLGSLPAEQWVDWASLCFSANFDTRQPDSRISNNVWGCATRTRNHTLRNAPACKWEASAGWLFSFADGRKRNRQTKKGHLAVPL